MELDIQQNVYSIERHAQIVGRPLRVETIHHADDHRIGP